MLLGEGGECQMETGPWMSLARFLATGLAKKRTMHPLANAG